MIELQYNADGKLEYRTSIGSEQIYRFGCNEPIFVTKWDEWKIVPSVEKEDIAPKDNNLRTERITLEITHDCATNIRDWHCWKRENFPLNPHESIRVVDTTAEAMQQSAAWDGAREAYSEGIARVKAERDEAREECERLRATVTILERRYLRCVDLRDADGDTIAALSVRVAELEAERDAAKEECGRLRHLLNIKESECETHHPWVHPVDAANCVDMLSEKYEQVKKELDEIKNSSAPVAWGVRMPEAKLWRCSSEKQAKKCVEYFGKGEVVALFEKPQPILTEAEQKK